MILIIQKIYKNNAKNKNKNNNKLLHKKIQLLKKQL